MSTNPLDVQIGGDHYKTCKIQPFQYAEANKLDAFQFSIIKYATRHKTKNGKQDLLKLIHVAQMAIELQYPEDYDVKRIEG